MTGFEAISSYCSAKATTFHRSSTGMIGEQDQRIKSIADVPNKKRVFQEKNRNYKDNSPLPLKLKNCDIDNTLRLRQSPLYSNSSVMGMLQFAFSDKENARPNFTEPNQEDYRNNKNDKDVASCRQKKALEHKGLQNELKRKDADLQQCQTLVDMKDKELQKMTHFMSTTLKGAIQDMTRIGDDGSDSRKEREEMKLLLNSQDRTIESLIQLIAEKDQALSDTLEFNEMNNTANTKLLAHIHEKHNKDLCYLNHQMAALHKMLRLKLKEKCYEKEIALVKCQMNVGTDMHQQFVTEVKFYTVMVVILMAFASQIDGFVYVAPLYFIVMMCGLE